MRRYLVAAAAVLLAACGGDGTRANPSNVRTVSISPATAQTTGVGGTLILAAVAKDSAGNVLPDAIIDWSSAQAEKVKLSATQGAQVVVTGEAVASNVAVTARSGQAKAQVSITVTNAAPPRITGVSASPLRPGLTGVTITGENFGAAVADNRVTIDGVAVPITAASTTSLTVDIPAGGFACTPVHDAAVQVTASGVSGAGAEPFQAAVPVDIGRGESVVNYTAGSGTCIELAPQASAQYVLAVVNTDRAANDVTNWRLVGSAGTAAVARREVASVRAARFAPGLDERLGAGAARAAAHQRIMERNRLALAQKSPGPASRRALRARVGSTARLSVGDTVPVHIEAADDGTGATQGYICLSGHDLKARVMKLTPHAVVLKDIDTTYHPVGNPDALFDALGDEFESRIYPVLVNNFGNPLAWDIAHHGRVSILFTPVLNREYQNVLGFVSVCDFLPFDTSSDPAQRNITSNEGPFFYAYFPDSAEQTRPGPPTSLDFWEATLRGVFAHETKHIVSFGEKFARTNGEGAGEAGWLEESTAQTSSEIYQRAFSGTQWKQRAVWNGQIGCEFPYTTQDGCTGDHPFVMLLHFDWLYAYLDNSTLFSPVEDAGEAYYGGAWSFVRWALDQYAAAAATGEGDFLKAIVDETQNPGIPNLEARTGQPYEKLITEWSLATALDNLAPGVTGDPHLSLPSWDQSAVFGGLHTVNGDRYARAYPLIADSVHFGTFTFDGNTLRGGGADIIALTGAQNGPQLLRLEVTGASLQTPPGSLHLSIVRVQ